MSDVLGNHTQECPHCKGMGKVEVIYQVTPDESDIDYEPCEVCHGSGWLQEE